MVLLKEENTSPLQWPLGHIKQIYPGKDGLVRVVDVTAKGNIYKRPLLKLAKLPISDEKDIFETIKAKETPNKTKKKKNSTKKQEKISISCHHSSFN